MTEVASQPKRPSAAKRWVVQGLAVIITVASFWFVFAALRSGSQRLGERLQSLSWPWVLVGVVAAALAMIQIALAWSRLLGVSAPVGLRWYFVGEIAKYVPGGIWPLLGRGELARRGGVAAGSAYSSVAWSLIYLFGTGAAVAGLAAPLLGNNPWLWLGLLAPVGLAVISANPVWRALRRRVPAVARLAVYDHGAAAQQVARALGTWATVGVAHVATMYAFGIDGSAPRIAAASVVAWVAGFIAVPVPGGAGVREAVFIAVSGLDSADGAVIALAARLVFVGVDVAGFLLAGGSALGRRNQRPRQGRGDRLDVKVGADKLDEPTL